MSSNLPEEWRPVVGYEGWYSVSCLGRVRRDRASNMTDAGYIMKPSLKKHGYLQVILSKDSQQKTFRLHKLVMEAFVGPYPAGMEIHHKDYDRTNNTLTNLSYVTRLENARYTVESGRYNKDHGKHGKHRVGIDHWKAKVTEDDVRAIRQLEGKLTHKEISRLYGVSQYTIFAIIRRKTWRHIA